MNEFESIIENQAIYEEACIKFRECTEVYEKSQGVMKRRGWARNIQLVKLCAWTGAAVATVMFHGSANKQLGTELPPNSPKVHEIAEGVEDTGVYGGAGFGLSMSILNGVGAVRNQRIRRANRDTIIVTARIAQGAAPLAQQDIPAWATRYSTKPLSEE